MAARRSYSLDNSGRSFPYVGTALEACNATAWANGLSASESLPRNQLIVPDASREASTSKHNPSRWPCCLGCFAICDVDSLQRLWCEYEAPIAPLSRRQLPKATRLRFLSFFDFLRPTCLLLLPYGPASS